MGKNKTIKQHNDAIVYSTNANFKYETEDDSQETLTPEEQFLVISLDKKQRKGKVVTLIDGFVGTDADLKDLEKKLKVSCGVGGSSKNGQIIIQGNLKEKITMLLTNWGYKIC